MKKICAGLLLPLLLTTTAGPSFGDGSPKTEKTRLRVVLLPYMSFAPLFIAQEEGFFTAEGLTIEWIKLKRTADAIAALIKGELDIVPGTITASQLNAMAKGVRITFVADKGYYDPAGCAYQAVLVRRAQTEGVSTGDLSLLKGKKINLVPFSYTGYIVEKILATSGLRLTDVLPVKISPATQLDAMEKGSIEATFTGEPWVTRLTLAGHSIVWAEPQKLLPGLQRGIVVYGPSIMEENREAGVRFMTAYLKAVRRYNEGKTARNIEILAKYTKLDRDVVRRSCWPPFRGDGTIDIQSILEFQAWARKKGLLDSAVSPARFWDSGFINAAGGRLK